MGSIWIYCKTLASDDDIAAGSIGAAEDGVGAFVAGAELDLLFDYGVLVALDALAAVGDDFFWFGFLLDDQFHV